MQANEEYMIAHPPDNLKQVFYSKLKCYPAINEFLGNALRDRMNLSEWLLNPIVQAIMSTDHAYFGNPTGIDKLLRKADPDVVRDIVRDLYPIKQDFDEKIWDSLPEVGASVWLRKDGHTNIQKLPARENKKGIKTPDLKSTKNGATTLTEVKHLRAPSAEEYLLWRSLVARVILNPNHYIRDFTINIEGALAFEDEYCSCDDVRAIEKLILQLDHSLAENENGDTCVCYEKSVDENDQGSLKKIISVEFKQFDKLDIKLSSTSHEYQSNSKHFTESKKKFKEIKVRKTVEKAIDQLNSESGENVNSKIVFLCWEKPEIILALEPDGYEKEIRDFVAELESEKKSDDPSLRIQLVDLQTIMSYSS